MSSMSDATWTRANGGKPVGAHVRRSLGALVTAALLATMGWSAPAPATAATIGLITSPAELAALPMSGAAWERMKAAADGPLGTPDIGDFNSQHDVRTLAVALVYGRTGLGVYRAKAADAIMSAIGTEDGGEAVMLGRNLISYVISADVIDLASFDPARDAQFRSWLSAVRFEVFSDGSIVSEDRKRANNHGRVAGAGRMAASLYLGDAADVAEAVAIFRGWLGDESAYDSFTWKNDLSWQADPANPVGVNPAGATKNGFSIDGALPEEMRRGCSFKVPPCPTTYPWGALQGTLLVAEMLSRQGYDAWNWEDRALLRAADFVHDLELAYGGWWAQGDDIWQPWLINHAYGTDYPTVPVTRVGKTFGWSDWLWGSSSGGGGGGAPLANFSATPRSGSAPLAVSFTDTSSNAPTDWAWSFGDGSSSAQQHPSHTYTAAGSYTVSLTATNGDGSDGETKVDYITVSPTGGGGGLTVTPSDDTYVTSSSPTAVNGSANNLRVRHSGSTQLHTYLKFSVSGAGSVGSATLRLWVLDASVDGGSLFEVPDSTWSESSMSWNTRKPISGGAIDSAGPVAVGSWVELDVSSLVSGDGTYSFALISAVSDVARYASSEASAATRPQLVLSGP